MDRPHYVQLEGPPRQRGQTHGESLRTVIGEVIGRLQALLAESHTIRPADYVAWLAGRGWFREAIRRWTPQLDEEIRGIAEGAALDYDLV